MYAHLLKYHLSTIQLVLMLCGLVLAFIMGKLLNKKQKTKKALTFFFAIIVFVLDYLSYFPGWRWVGQVHSTWIYFESWHDLFSFFEFVFLPFDFGLLLSWIKCPIKREKEKKSQKAC